MTNKLYLLCIFIFSFNVQSHSLTIGEWVTVSANKETLRFHKKRALEWTNDDKKIKTCNEHVWGDVNLFLVEMNETNQQLEYSCNFIAYKNKKMIISERVIRNLNAK
jgi:hypothetical protein